MLEKFVRISSYITLLMLSLMVSQTALAVSEGELSLTATGTISVITPTSLITDGSWAYFAMLKGTTTKSQVVNTDMCLGSSGTGPDPFSATSTFRGVNLFTSFGLGIGSNPSFADCTTAGYYYLMVSNGVSGGYYPPNTYWRVYYDGSTVVPSGGFSPDAGYDINFTSQYETRFTNLVYSTTTSTTTLTVGFYIDPSEATSTQADKNPTIVRYRYSKVPSTDVSGIGIGITDALSPTWGNGTTSGSFVLDTNSTYDFTISFANGGTPLTGVTPFPLAYIYLRLTTNATGGIASTSSPEFYNAVEEQAFQYQPCGITDIGGCITNSFAYLFIPSNESLDRFNSLSSELENRSPFVYVYQVPAYWNTLYNTADSQSLTISASTSIGNFTFLSASLIEAVPYSSTLRTLIGYLLWVMLAFTVYARVTRLFNHQDKTV